MSAYTDSGVIGYPSRASAEKGRAVINHLGKAAGNLITLLVEPHAQFRRRDGSRPLALPSAATDRSGVAGTPISSDRRAEPSVRTFFTGIKFLSAAEFAADAPGTGRRYQAERFGMHDISF
jgi:hypothetical protein